MAVAKAKRKNSSKRNARRSSGSATHRRTKRRNGPGTKIVVIGPKRSANRHHRRHARRNPSFMGTHVTAVKMAELVAGGLVGVAINKTILPMLPAVLTQNNFAATATAIALAAAEWWAASMLDKEFGAAVGFGGLMNAMSQGLNAFVPSVGSYVSLAGRRGTGDLVPGARMSPFWPVIDPSSGLAGPGGVMSGAYPSAYGRIAA